MPAFQGAGGLSDGSVTSSHIEDDTIVNADIYINPAVSTIIFGDWFMKLIPTQAVLNLFTIS